MIAFLRGQVLAKLPNSVILDVGGVGYSVNVPPALASTIRVGSEAELHITLILREDSVTLYGFTQNDEKQLFELMLSVTGVGPRSALAIVSTLSSEEIAGAVESQRDEVFRRVPGIGPKTAKLITVSLVGKVGAANSSGASSVEHEVLQALLGLGYNEKQALGAIRKSSASSSTAELLKTALQVLSERNV